MSMSTDKMGIVISMYVSIIPKRIVKDIIKGIWMEFQITQTADYNKGYP
jgi:hypothetical protein